MSVEYNKILDNISNAFYFIYFYCILKKCWSTTNWRKIFKNHRCFEIIVLGNFIRSPRSGLFIWEYNDLLKYQRHLCFNWKQNWQTISKTGKEKREKAQILKSGIRKGIFLTFWCPLNFQRTTFGFVNSINFLFLEV